MFEPLGAVLKNIFGQKGEGEAVACLLYMDSEYREACSGALQWEHRVSATGPPEKSLLNTKLGSILWPMHLLFPLPENLFFQISSAHSVAAFA